GCDLPDVTWPSPPSGFPCPQQQSVALQALQVHAHPIRVQVELLRELGGAGRAPQFAEEREQPRPSGLGQRVLGNNLERRIDHDQTFYPSPLEKAREPPGARTSFRPLRRGARLLWALRGRDIFLQDGCKKPARFFPQRRCKKNGGRTR